MLPASKLATDERSRLASQVVLAWLASVLQPLARDFLREPLEAFLWLTHGICLDPTGRRPLGTNLLVFIHILTKGNQAARTASSEASSAASAAASFFTSACMRYAASPSW